MATSISVPPPAVTRDFSETRAEACWTWAACSDSSSASMRRIEAEERAMSHEKTKNVTV